jgi:hypothetical protein
MSDELFDAPSSPLSMALNTAMLEASSRATDGNATGLISEPSDTARFVKSGSTRSFLDRGIHRKRYIRSGGQESPKRAPCAKANWV